MKNITKIIIGIGILFLLIGVASAINLDDFKAQCNKCGVQLNVHIGEVMMHCWGAMDFVPEAKAVRQEYFKAIGNTTKEICVHEYGDPSDPLIVLLAPMLLSVASVYL